MANLTSDDAAKDAALVLKTPLGEPPLEDTIVYGRALGQYRRHPKAFAQSALWWHVLRIASRAQAPLQPHAHFVHTSSTTRRSCLSAMVDGNVRAICNEFMHITTDTAWAQLLQTYCAAQSDMAAMLWHQRVFLQVGLSLAQNASYWRRLLVACSQHRPYCLTTHISTCTSGLSVLRANM